MADTAIAPESSPTAVDGGGAGVTEVAPIVKGPRPAWMLVAGPVGLIALAVALALMTSSVGPLRVLLAVAGVLAMMVSIGAVADRVAGRRTDVSLGLAFGWLILVILAAIFADLLPLGEALDQAKTLSTPARMRPDLFSGHPLGTDTQALDMLGGVVYGARVSLQVGLGAVAIGTIIGGFIGVIAGYFRGSTDGVIGLLTDALLAFPPLILLLAVVSALDATVLNISLVLALLSIPTYVRLARANTMVFAQREFVLAARSVGASHWRIIARELIPNVIRPLLAYSSIIIAVIIVAEASLSYLGVGIDRPTPTWGNMIKAGEQELETTPHLVFVPGVVMFATVLALNRVGDWARTRWDPRQSKL